MKPALIYRNTTTYEAVMLALYGRHYFSRYRALADLIEPGSSVLDLCCGPGILYQRYLRKKEVTYTGLDLNEEFVRHVNDFGGNARGLLWDLREARELPPADFVLMQASLYHFLPGATTIVDRMLRASRKRVIVAEPIRNWVNGKTPILNSVAKRWSDPGTGHQQRRFSQPDLDELFAPYSSKIVNTFLIPGGREKVYVLAAQ